MSVREIIGYAVYCDFPGCGIETVDVNGEYSSWTDRAYAIEDWTDADGYSGPEGDYCAEHTVWDDDADERRPLLYSIDALFILAEIRIAERIESSTRRALWRHEQRYREADARAASRRVTKRQFGAWAA